MGNGEGKIVVTISPDLEPLAAGYIDNRQRDVEALKDALMRNDFESIRILGHSMKGSGGGYGFDQITEFGRDIEQAAKLNNAAILSELTEKLSDYLARIDIVYD